LRDKLRVGASLVVGDRYTTASYGRAIREGCKRARVPRWAANQLRHAALTEVRATFDLDTAQDLGGHKQPTTTGRYAKPTGAGEKAARRLG